MTVNELIEELRKYPADMLVLSDNGMGQFFAPDLETQEMTPVENTKFYIFFGSEEGEPKVNALLIW